MAKLERFYNTFQPDHYDVFIDINRAKKTINGKTTITGNATDPQIAINQKICRSLAFKQPVKN